MNIRALQGHPGGALVDPELLKKDGRLSSFQLRDPFRDELDEEYEDLTQKKHEKYITQAGGE